MISLILLNKTPNSIILQKFVNKRFMQKNKDASPSFLAKQMSKTRKRKGAKMSQAKNSEPFLKNKKLAIFLSS
jgi:hypothetical protein